MEVVVSFCSLFLQIIFPWITYFWRDIVSSLDVNGNILGTYLTQPKDDSNFFNDLKLLYFSGSSIIHMKLHRNI